MYYLMNKNEKIAKTAFEGGCLTPETRKTLIGLREFVFEKHPKYNLPVWRLEALTAEMHAIIDAILEKDALRTKQIAVK